MQMLLYIILMLVRNIISATKTYEIYDTGNSYPRPVLLRSNEVLALSGKEGGSFIRYSSNAEVITPKISLFDYHNNADIKQLNGEGNENKFVSVSGVNTEFDIILFSEEKDENGSSKIQYSKTKTNHYTNSFKISLVPLNSGDILVGWTNNG